MLAVTLDNLGKYGVDQKQRREDALARAGVRGYSLEQCLADYRHAILIYYCRAVIAICTVGMIDGPAGRQIDPRNVEGFTPVLRRYHAAILDHFPSARE